MAEIAEEIKKADKKTGLSLVRLRFYTKDTSELISYQMNKKGLIADLPVVYVYEHNGTEQEALEAFMPLGSFAFAETGDSFLAFPLKGAAKVGKSIQRLIHRVENGKVYDLSNVCELCKDRVRKALSGCDPCEGLRSIRQVHPMIIKNLKGSISYVKHHGDRRSAQRQEVGLGKVKQSGLL